MVQELQVSLKKIENEMSVVGIKVSGVLSLLKGNELDKGDNGMLGELADMRVRLDKLEKFNTKVIYVALGMSLPASYGVLQIIQNIILHK